MEQLAILDCGGQYTKVIDRKVRELEVKCDIFSINVSPEKLKDYGGIILSGGPESVWKDNALKCDHQLFHLGIPILGICYGMQLINAFFDGEVSPDVKKEFGEEEILIDNLCPLFENLDTKETVLMSHGDSVKKLADGFKISARSGDVIAGIYNLEKNIYGVQFHPEVDLTINGKTILDNFLRKICKFKERYSLDDRISMSIKQIKEKVGNGKVLALVSGGVDSAVTVTMLLRALPPENIYAIHVDHGLMRKNESDLICKDLESQGLINLKRVNGKEFFLNAYAVLDGKKVGPLSSTIDPEEKRAIIGEAFINIVKKVCDELSLDFETTFLAQGTLRPDLIESGNPDVSSHAHKIKTHHNDVEIVRKARDAGRVIETNSDWHKDEVRQVAKMLGLDEKIAMRQPFPGPGIGVRIMCSDGTETLNENEKNQLSNTVSEYGNGFSGVLLPLKTVGVQGDWRSFQNLAMVHCDPNIFNWNDCYSLSKIVTNKLSFVNRLVYPLAHRGTLENIKISPLYINAENVSFLQEIDALVTDVLNIKSISQSFAVLLPIGVNKKHSVAIRTFVTNDFMTGRPAIIGKEISKETIFSLAERILQQFDEIEFVFYDVTGKPPATCEWQ